MKNITLFLVALFSATFLLSQKIKSGNDAKVEALLKKMSIEEKVGQMTQLTIGPLMDKSNDELKFDPEKLEEAILKYGLGSILNTTTGAYSIEDWHRLLTEIQDLAMKTPNKIPVMYGIDAIHGTSYTQNSTLFPHNIGLAASRNIGLIKEATKITALETRASGIRWNFDPVLDVGREPLWPRFPETFGEDPYLVSQMGVAVITGYEEDGLSSTSAVASCMKHFVGYSAPANGKDRTSAYIPEMIMWEYYYPPFQAAIDAGSSTIMINSATVNGIPIHGSKYYLKEILRDRFGFEGMIVSDWEDIIRLYTRHKVATSPREAVKIGVEAGIDMSMVPRDYSFADHLVDLVKSGEVSEERIDESVRKILILKFNLGLFDNPYPEKGVKANFGKPEYKTTALKAARESIVLLKNEEQQLPLSKDLKVLVVGPTANNLGSLNGSWSYTWQGKDEGKYPESYQTLVEGLQTKLGEDKVSSMAYADFDDYRNFDQEKLTQMAKEADHIILCLGEYAYAESPGVIDDLGLPKAQLELALAANATGKPVTLVMIEGRPRIIREIEPAMKSILLALRPGSQGAAAIADILFGDYCPAGVLPFSYPKYTGDIIPYDRRPIDDVAQRKPSKVTKVGYSPQWAFGHGLSYTSFEYSEISLSAKEISRKESIQVKVDIKNTGQRKGMHAVDLYLSDLFASVSPPVQRLKRFDKIELAPGESKTVSFTLTTEDLKFYNFEMKHVAEAGEFKVRIGDKEAFFHLK